MLRAIAGPSFNVIRYMEVEIPGEGCTPEPSTKHICKKKYSLEGLKLKIYVNLLKKLTYVYFLQSFFVLRQWITQTSQISNKKMLFSPFFICIILIGFLRAHVKFICLIHASHYDNKLSVKNIILWHIYILKLIPETFAGDFFSGEINFNIAN